MTLIVGSATTPYDLDLRPFRQSIATARRELADFQRAAAQISARSVAGAAPIQGAGAAAQSAQATRAAQQQAQAQQQTAVATARVTTAQNQAAISAQRLSQAQAQAATAAQRQQTAAVQTATALQRQAAATAQAEAAQLRLAQAQARAQAGAQGLGTNGGLPVLPRTIAGLSGAAASFAGSLGVGVGGAALVSGGLDAGRRALELDRTIRLTRELSGTQETYNLVLEAARRQQELYGGSLQENIEGLAGLVITARSSGAELNQLIDLSQRLSLLDPSQGTAGARIALSEALSGDPRSLALRYEIPRAALERIRDESLSTSERLAVLDQYLGKIGITSAVVTSAVSDQALAYNRLSAEIDTLVTRTGQGLSDTFEGAARGLGRLIGLVNNNPQALAELRAVVSGGGADVAQAEADLLRRRAQESLRSGGLGGTSLLATGARARLAGQIGDETGGSVRNMQTGALEASSAIQQLESRVMALMAVSPAAAAAVERLNDQLVFGKIEGPAYADALARLERQFTTGSAIGQIFAGALGIARSATEQQTRAATGLSEELRKQLIETQQAAQRSQQLADAQRTIASIGGQVANGIMTVAQAASYLATRYGFAADEASRLAREASAAALAAKADVALADQRAGERNPGVSSAAEERRLAEAARIRQQQARAAEEARRDQLVATGTAAQAVAVRQQELNEALARYGQGSAEAIRAETALIAARQRQAAISEKAAASGAKAISQEEATLGKLEDRTEDYYIKLLQLQEDYQTRARRSQEDFELGRSRDSEDFQRQRQRLLAEGKIAEARLLEEGFNRQQAREAQDEARRRQRASEDLGTQVRRQAADLGVDQGRIVDRAALRGVQVPGGAAQVAGATVPAGAGQVAGVVPLGPLAAVAPATAAAAAPRQVVPLSLTVQVAPTQVQIDGERIVEVTWPAISERIDLELAQGIATISLTAPANGGQGSGVGGPRP